MQRFEGTRVVRQKLFRRDFTGILSKSKIMAMHGHGGFMIGNLEIQKALPVVIVALPAPGCSWHILARLYIRFMIWWYSLICRLFLQHIPSVDRNCGGCHSFHNFTRLKAWRSRLLCWNLQKICFCWESWLLHPASGIHITSRVQSVPDYTQLTLPSYESHKLPVVTGYSFSCRSSFEPSLLGTICQYSWSS